MSVKHLLKTLCPIGLGFLIRVALMSCQFKESIKQRVEVTTPISSWKRVDEAVYLTNSGLDPYSGNIFHEYPISLQFYKILISYFNVDMVFAATDVITAFLLSQSVFNQMKLSETQPSEEAKSQSFKVLLVYLFSPITIISCVGTSTSIFTNFLISIISLTSHMKSFKALTCVLCALLACNNIHFATLIIPFFLCQEYCTRKKKQKPGNNSNDANSLSYYEEPDFYSSLSNSLIIFSLTSISLISASYLIMGNSWSFITSTYLFALKVQDLTPNIGMFWYFFTEIFEHFLDFFTWTMQINAFIHIIPLSICLRNNPFFLSYVTILTSTIFQPYPSLSNIGLITSLLPQWVGHFDFMKRGLIVVSAGLVCMSLWPVFWHLWIMMGTANSNFYFGSTLAFTATLIWFMIDLLNAHGHLEARVKFGILKKGSEKDSTKTTGSEIK